MSWLYLAGIIATGWFGLSLGIVIGFYRFKTASECDCYMCRGDDE